MSLTAPLCPLSANHLVVSQWNKRIKFNGFFFAVNLAIMQPAAFDEDNLFDPDAIMVGGEEGVPHPLTIPLTPSVLCCVCRWIKKIAS